jgi:hypothetical protein
MREPCICAAADGEEHLPVCPWFVGRAVGHMRAPRLSEHEHALRAVALHIKTFKTDPTVVMLTVDSLLDKVAEQRLCLRKLRALAALAAKPAEPERKGDDHA